MPFTESTLPESGRLPFPGFPETNGIGRQNTSASPFISSGRHTVTPILRLCIPRSGYGSGSYALLVTVTEPQFPFTRKPYLQSLIIPTDFSLSPHIPMKLSAGTSCETAF